MSLDLHPPLDTLAAGIRTADRQADARLPLLWRAERILSGECDASPDERQELADRLEWWRYECLGVGGGGLSPEDRQLVDALDLAADWLAGRDRRPPRRSQAAIEDAGFQADRVGRAAACLDVSRSLDELTDGAVRLTREHFDGACGGRRRMLLYAPLYLSSLCVNQCAYCGFRSPNDVRRRHLDHDEAMRQAEILRGRGFRHILLVAGDFPRLTTTEYFADVIHGLRGRGISPAVEIAPQTTSSYARLAEAGCCGVTLYQETYDRRRYGQVHPGGRKAQYDWRLEGLERAAEAGMRRLGLGVLLGLADPRPDFLAMVRHGVYLESRFPDRTLAFSLPRIHQAPEGFRTPFAVDDETFIRLYCGLRAAFPSAELVLSTREAESLRDRLARVCITQLSAGSSTVPGGYGPVGGQGAADASEPCDAQFPVSDRRNVGEVARWLETAGFEVVWNVPVE